MPTPLSHRQVWIRFLLYPAHTLPTALAPVLVAAGLAVHDHVAAALPLALAFVASWLVHVAGVLGDNHELLRRHADVPEHPELLQALASGTLSLRALRTAIAACLVLSAVVGLPLALRGGVPVLVLGAVGIAASLGYACGPLPYAKRGLADPLFFAMFGVVAVAGAYFAQAVWLDERVSWRTLPATAYVAGLPVGALVTAVLVIDDLRDRGFDAKKGWHTTAVRFGTATARAWWIALVGFAYAAPLWFWLGLGVDPAVFLCWATAPAAWAIGRAVVRVQDRTELVVMTPRASLLAMAFAALLAVGLALPTA